MHICLCNTLALLARLEAINDVSVFDAQNSGCRSLRSFFPPSERMVCVVSKPQLKEAFKHVLINGWGQKQAPRVDVCKALCFFPVAFADAALFWLASLQVHSSAKLSAPGNFLTKFAKDSCSKNLIFQFWKKDVYSPHYCGIMWKMYKTCQCCL